MIKPRGPNNQETQKNKQYFDKPYECIKFNNIKLSNEIKKSKFPFIHEKNITLIFPLYKKSYSYDINRFLPFPETISNDLYTKIEIQSELDKGFTKPDLFKQIKDFYLNLSKINDVFYIEDKEKKLIDLRLEYIFKEKDAWIVKIK